MKKDSGLTYIEILIMIVVLGVVAAITFPKFKVMLYQSREARTKTRLGELRGGVAIYYSDYNGIYPPDRGTPETRLASSLVPNYIKSIPYVDLKHVHPKKLNTVQDRLNLIFWMIFLSRLSVGRFTI